MTRAVIMKLETFSFSNKEGWSVKSFPDLDSESTLILIFSASDFINNPKPIQELAKHYPTSKIIGCSSAGEISGATVSDNSISVAVAKFEKTKLGITKKALSSAKDSFEIGKCISDELFKNDLRSIFILSDGLNVNGSELVKGLNTSKKEGVIITGGLAGDGSRFQKTWAIYNGEILTDQVIGVGFYGNHVQIGHGSRGGWDIFGPERIITKSKNNILYELDNKPALQLYKEYLGERASELPASGLLFPLSIRSNENDSNQVVRTILAVSEKDQSLTFAGDMPTGYLAQLMRANFDRLITAADEVGDVASKMLVGIGDEKVTPILTIAISCVGRRLLLGERTEEETIATLESMPANTQQVGFYSYGEISPYGIGDCYLHNQTMTLTTISEED